MARAATAESGEASNDILIEDGSTREPLEVSPVVTRPVPGALSTGELALPTAASRRWRTDFIGRDDELGQLVSAWEQRRRFNLVLGEVGRGKNASHSPALAARSRRRWIHCLGSLQRRASRCLLPRSSRSCVSWSRPRILVKLSAAVGNRGELTRLIPELVEKVGTLRAPTRAEAGTEQRLLFESVATLLGAWSPLVLVLDDLHWADEATMALLGYLVGSGDVGQLVIVGYGARHRSGPVARRPAGRLRSFCGEHPASPGPVRPRGALVARQRSPRFSSQIVSSSSRSRRQPTATRSSSRR